MKLRSPLRQAQSSTRLKIGLLTVFAVLITLPACWTYSLHPLYDDAHLTYDPLLEGTWLGKAKDDDCPQCRLVSTGDSKTQNYTIVLIDLDKTHSRTEPDLRFEAHLVQLGQERFLDAVADGEGAGIGTLIAHNVFKVLLDANSLVLIPLNDDWLCSASEAEQKPLGECVNGGFVLTAHTDVIQDFVRSHANDAGVFPDPGEDDGWLHERRSGESK
jgi:hypothetical protein